MMKYDYVYDSVKDTSEKSFEFEKAGKPEIVVLFLAENILLMANREGNALFLDMDGKELYKDCAEAEDTFFSRIECKASKNILTVCFVRTKTVDNYPHCDGEYDRWDEIVVKKIPITYTL